MKTCIVYVVEAQRASQLTQHSIVGATLEGTAMSILRRTDIGVVLQDEAAQTPEAKTLMSLARCKQWIQIGDHNQLPPTVKCPLAKDALMEISLFERLIVE